MSKNFHLLFSFLALITSGIVIWNQYLNGPRGGDLALWDYIDPVVVMVLLLVVVFHIREALKK